MKHVLYSVSRILLFWISVNSHEKNALCEIVINEEDEWAITNKFDSIQRSSHAESNQSRGSGCFRSFFIYFYKSLVCCCIEFQTTNIIKSSEIRVQWIEHVRQTQLHQRLFENNMIIKVEYSVRSDSSMAYTAKIESLFHSKLGNSNFHCDGKCSRHCVTQCFQRQPVDSIV